MKQISQPTLSEIREMLGEELYVKFVWMWREQEQDKSAAERRARFPAVMPERNVEAWPTPLFSRSDANRIPAASAAKPIQAALLRAPRAGIEGTRRQTGT